VERNSGKILDFEAGDRSFGTYLQIALRLQEKFNIKWLCTDDYEVYKKIQIAEKHIITKAETSLVEANNSSLRGKLARLNRRTKKFSKSEEILRLTMFLFIFYKNWNFVNWF
jgi:insertion element IS1 protein InsB